MLVRTKWQQKKLHGWCLHRCTAGDCGAASKDGNVIISSRCDERINQVGRKSREFYFVRDHVNTIFIP